MQIWLVDKYNLKSKIKEVNAKKNIFTF